MEEIKSVGGGSGFGDGGDGNEYRRNAESDENEIRKSSYVPPRSRSARSTNGKFIFISYSSVGGVFNLFICSE